MICYDAKEEIDYVLERELGSDVATSWRLRPITGRQRAKIEDAIALWSEGGEKCFGTLNHMLLRFGLVGWSNLRDSQGYQVVFAADQDGAVSDAILDRLPFNVRAELAAQILRSMRLTDDDVKN